MFKVTDYVKDSDYDTPGSEGYLRKHAIKYVSCGGVADVMTAVGQILNSRDSKTVASKTFVIQVVGAEMLNTRTVYAADMADIAIAEIVIAFLKSNTEDHAGLNPYASRQIVFEF